MLNSHCRERMFYYTVQIMLNSHCKYFFSKYGMMQYQGIIFRQEKSSCKCDKEKDLHKYTLLY